MTWYKCVAQAVLLMCGCCQRLDHGKSNAIRNCEGACRRGVPGNKPKHHRCNSTRHCKDTHTDTTSRRHIPNHNNDFNILVVWACATHNFITTAFKAAWQMHCLTTPQNCKCGCTWCRCCRYAWPPWPNGQGVGLLIRRLRARVPQGVNISGQKSVG